MKRFTVPVLLLAAVAALWLALRRNPHHGALEARTLATRGLAEHLALAFPGRRALVVSNPFTQQKNLPPAIRAMEEAGLRGLKEGFGAKLTIAAVAFPDLKPEARTNPRAVEMDSETTTPLSYLVAEDAFDKLAGQHPDCDLIVSLIGLPAELALVKCWQSPDRPKFALLLPDLRVLGGATAVQEAVKKGKLVAFVLNRPGVPDSQPAPGEDFKAEFEKRFVLVTSANFDAMFQAHPNLFPAE